MDATFFQDYEAWLDSLTLDNARPGELGQEDMMASGYFEKKPSKEEAKKMIAKLRADNFRISWQVAPRWRDYYIRRNDERLSILYRWYPDLVGTPAEYVAPSELRRRR